MEEFKKWARAALIRTAKTMAETAAGMIATNTFIETVPWKAVASATVISGILTLLWAVKGLPELEQKGDIDNGL